MVSDSKPTSVAVHPLVLLSVVDHYHRAARNTTKRVVGVLLGQSSQGKVNVASSFAVPFEEDDKDPNVWFVDHDYIELMADMFRKVNGNTILIKAKEKLVGWYHSGPSLRQADLHINELFKKYTTCPVLLIVSGIKII
jgi:26S proteasome regulatory subunit N8